MGEHKEPVRQAAARDDEGEAKLPCSPGLCGRRCNRYNDICGGPACSEERPAVCETRENSKGRASAFHVGDVFVQLVLVSSPHELSSVSKVAPCKPGDPHILVTARFFVSLCCFTECGPSENPRLQ